MTRSIFVGLLAVALLAVLLPLGEVQAHESCDVPKVQTHRGIQGTFDQCVDASFTDDGDELTVHVYYTETTNSSDAQVCADDDDLTTANCEHALPDNDDANGDNVFAVAVAGETVDAWQFFRQREIPIVSGTHLNVFIGDDRRGGGIPDSESLWWDDEWVDDGDDLLLRLLAYHEAFHLAQIFQYGGAGGSHIEGVARAIEDRVDPALDADTGHLFIPEFQQHMALEGPASVDSDGNIATPRGRADSLDDQWYWSMPWWTWLFDQNAAPTDTEPQIGWDAIADFYDAVADNSTEVGAVNDLVSPGGFAESFRDYGQALFAYPWAPSPPELRYTDAEVNANTGPITGHTVRTGSPAPQTDSLMMNPRSNRHIEYQPGAGCEAVSFEFDGNGQSYGWAALGVEQPALATRSQAVGTSWAATVLTGDNDRIGGVITSTGSSGTVDVESGCTEPTVEIENPTTSNQAIVGEASDPRRLLARVDVDGPDGEPVQGLSADAFEVVLQRDGTELPATVESAAEVQSDYWLLLDLPDDADGAQTGLAYDLVARLASAEDTQASSVLYAEQPDRDLLVVTDRSGSMADGDKIEAARNAGELLIEELIDDDQASYTAFDDTAVVREPLAPVGVADHRDDVQDAMRAETPDGATSIGAGMNAAASEHDTRGLDANACAFVLLSDGAENTDPRWSDVVADVVDNGCPLHVVGLGPGANEPLLQQIAGAGAGGSYDYAGTGADAGSASTAATGTATTAGHEAGGATTWQNGLAAIYDLAATNIGARERLQSTGFDTPPPAMTCTEEVVDVDWADASPEQVTVGEQMTSRGVTFDGRLHTSSETGEGSAEVTDDNEVLFDFLTLETTEPACRVVMDMRMFNATGELRVNGDIETFRNPDDLDGVEVGGVTVEVQNFDDSTGEFRADIVLAGNLTSYGLGGTFSEDVEFPGRVFLSSVRIERGEIDGIPIMVDPTTERLVVTATSQDPVPGRLTQLYRPDGTPEPPESATREPHGSSEVWNLVAPPPGEWLLVVNDQFTSPGLVTASAESDITLELLLEPTDELIAEAESGVEVPIVAMFSGQGGPITGGDVTATITDPSGFATTATMHDDGEHGDGAADDGFYGTSYTATSFGDVTATDPADGDEPQVAGSYRVDVVGISGDDRREDSGSFALAEGTDSDGDGLPDAYEIAHGLDPDDPTDGGSDGDRDGLDAVCEFQAGTDPRNADTDGGGAADVEEITRNGRCRPGPTDPLDPDDDPISPLDSLVAVPELDDAGNPIVVLTWGDPEDDGDELVDVDIWCQLLDPATLLPAGGWELIASDVAGNTFTDTDVSDGEVRRCQVIPTVDGGEGPQQGTPQTSSPVPVSDDPFPPEGTIQIEGGAPTTPDEIVDLDLTVDDLSAPGHAGEDPGPVNGSAPGDIEMRIGNGAVMPDDAPWQPFSPEVADWELDPDDDGQAVVSVQFRDGAGNVGAGGLFMKDSIQVVGGDVDEPRLAGRNRIETAVDISRDLYDDGGAGSAVIARADTYPDALAGGPLAVDVDAPLLLTFPDSLAPPTATELSRVLPPGNEVIVLGGTAAISPATEAAIADLGYSVRRVAGATRIHTAVQIAENLGDPDPLLLATGFNFPDALAAGAAASRVGGAVLLVGEDARAPATDAYLATRPDAELFGIGGPAARPYPEATPIIGSGRDQTAVLVAEAFFDEPNVVGIARNDDFPDALAGGPHVARRGGPMLLTPSAQLTAPPADYICGQSASLSSYFIYGGEAAISAATADAVADRIEDGGC